LHRQEIYEDDDKVPESMGPHDELMAYQPSLAAQMTLHAPKQPPPARKARIVRVRERVAVL
jgi:hypothetical protein